MITDIVIGTHNRVEMLRRTIECIQERTKLPYRLSVIDDASTDGTVDYVKSLGLRLYRHEKQAGMHQNLIDVAKVSTSDPVICTDDDALCPLLEPDWLYRLLTAMSRRPKLQMLNLNNPSNNKTGSHGPYQDDGVVVYSQYASGQFLAIRRRVIIASAKLFLDRKSRKSPNKTQARWVHAQGGLVGSLKGVYTWHFCPESIRLPGKSWENILVEPIDMVTLEPPEEYRECRIP